MKKRKKRLIILLSLFASLATALILFCTITGFNPILLIKGTKPSGNKVDTETDLETLVLETPTDGTTPKDYDALTNFAYFAYKLQNSDFEATTNGKATANFNGMNTDQNVYDYRLKSGKYYLMDTRSTSQWVKIYEEQFFTGDKVLYRSSSDSANYDKVSKVEARSNKQEFNLYGYGPDKIIGYIVCKETLVEDSGVNQNADGTFTSSYTLDPTVAPTYYQRKVKTNASISSYPNFVSVNLTYTYDSNWNIISATYNEVYSIYKMKSWIKTTTNITETFTYLTSEESQSKIDAKYNFYKDYFDLEVPADSDDNTSTEMTALDYLGTMVGLISKPIYGDVVLKVNDKELNAKVSYDGTKETLYIKIGDELILYKENKLYFNGSIEGYLDIAELKGLIPSSESKESIIDTTSLISGVMKNINAGVVSHDGEYTNVSITFDLFGLSIPTVFRFYTPNEDTIEFKTLTADFAISDNNFSVRANLCDSFDTTVNTDVSMLRSLSANVNTKLTYNDLVLDLNGTINADLLNKVISIDAKTLYNNATINLNVIYKDNYIYINALDKLKLMISVDEIKQMIPENTTSFDITSLNYDLIMSYIKNISLNINSSIDLSYNTELDINGIKLSNIMLSLTPSSDEYSVDVNGDDYINYDTIKPYIEQIKTLISNSIESNGLQTKINITYDKYSLSGDIYVKFDELSLKAILNISFDDISRDIVLYYVNNNIYLEYENVKVKVSKDTLTTAISKFVDLNTDLDVKAIIDLFKSINVSDTIDLVLNTSNYIGSDLTIKLDKDLNISLSSSKINGSITNTSAYQENISVEDVEYVNIDSYVDTISTLVKDILDNNGLQTKINITYDKYSLSGDIYVKFDELSLKAILNISFDDISRDIVLYYVNNNIYLEYENVKVKVSKDTLTTAISKFVDLNTDLDVKAIIDLFKSINVSDTIDLVLNTSNYIGSDLTIKLDKDLNISLSSSKINGSITNISSFGEVINVVDESYISIDGLINDGLNIYDVIKTNTFEVNINDLSLKIADHNVELNGNIYVNKSNACITLNALIDSKHTLNLTLKVIDKVMYIEALGQIFKLDLENINTFIDDVLNKLNIMLDKNYTLDTNKEVEVSNIVKVLDTLIFTNNSISLDLESLISKALTITVELVTKDSITNANINTEGYVEAVGKISITSSTEKDIVAPAGKMICESEILEILDYVNVVYNIAQQKLFSVNINELRLEKADPSSYFEISGEVKLNVIDGLKDFDAILNLTIVEYRNNVKYGWHYVELTIISSTKTGGDAMVYGAYGNNESNKSDTIKVYSTYTGIKNLINSVQNLMNIDTFSNMMDSGSLMIKFDKLINDITLSDTSLDLVLDQSAFNKFMSNSSYINISLTKSDDKLTNIELQNLYLSYSNERDNMKISSLDISINEILELNVEAPSDTSKYIDLTNMSNLFEALYENAQMKYFEISGNVKLTAIGILEYTAGVNAKIHVQDDGKPEALITINCPTFWQMIYKKTLYIYYKDGFIYQNRIDNDSTLFWKSSNKYFLKISYQEYMNDFLNYFLGEYGLGMPDNIMSKINSSTGSNKGTPNAASCVNSASIGTNKFSFNFDLGEIVQDSNIGDLNVTLSTTEITNTEGKTVNVLKNIDSFSLDMVSVIHLTSSNLTLSNIYDGMCHDLDMSDLYNFVSSADQTYAVDTKYKNGSSQGTISHTITYDYNGITTTETKNYNDIINLPSTVEINGTTYNVISWYTDKTYQTKVDGNSYTMPAYDKTLYAKI